MLKRNPLFNRIKALFPRIPPSVPDPSLQSPVDRPVAGVSIKPTHRIKMGFSYRQEMVTALEETPPPLPKNAHTSPLIVAGTAVGAIQIAADETTWTGRETEIVDGVAALLAHHLDILSHPERNEQQKHE
jgi:hypothetical protein